MLARMRMEMSDLRMGIRGLYLWLYAWNGERRFKPSRAVLGRCTVGLAT